MINRNNEEGTNASIKKVDAMELDAGSCLFDRLDLDYPDPVGGPDQ
jgi:hypothetical protein